MSQEEEEEEEEESLHDTSLCSECRTVPHKYSCPACQTRTCSAQCVKEHKRRTGCTGKRKRTTYTSLGKFDDTQLRSDVTFLEEGTRTVARESVALKYPRRVQDLVRRAKQRGVKLILFPKGSTQRESNTTRFDKKKDAIFWCVRWVVGDSLENTHQSLVAESTSLIAAAEEVAAIGPGATFSLRNDGRLAAIHEAGMREEDDERQVENPGPPYLDIANPQATLGEILVGLHYFPHTFANSLNALYTGWKDNS